jgi:iron-sulfur cluster assembly protein
VLTLTANATDTIERILASPGVPDGAGLRITPSAQGVDSADGSLQLAVAEQPGEGDQVIEDHGARVFVQDSLTDSLDEMLLDADVMGEQVQFMLGARPEGS